MQGHDSPSFLWKEVPRRGGGWLTQRNKKEWRRSIFSYHLPKHSRGRFFRLPLAFPFANETPRSRSVWSTVFPVFRCPPISFMTANEKDFSLSLEMTVREKQYSHITFFPTRGGFVCRHDRSKSFCCLSEIKKEHCHRAMLFLTFCAYQKYSFQARKIVPSGKFRRACILIPALRVRG